MIGTFLEKAGMSTGFVFPTRAFLLFVTVVFYIEINLGYSTWNTDPDKHCHDRHNLKIRNC